VDLDRLAVVRRRMHEQGLAGEGFSSPAAAVTHLGAVQAQEFAEANWSLAERVLGCTPDDVEEAFARGDILRVHALRPTWHYVAAADLRWIQALTGPRVHQANAYHYRQVGMDESTIARSNETLAAVLADGEPRTRRELGGALDEAGVEGAEGVRLAHLMMYAELDAVVCSGPRRGKQHTYALVSHRVSESRELSGDEALAELTRRYFVSHGPATVRDFSWWSGLTMGQARRGLALVELDCAEDADGKPWYAARRAAEDTGPSGCHLIPMFDELSVSYKDLRMVLRDEPPAEGMLERPVLMDGECVGTWRRRPATDPPVLDVTLFSRLRGPERSQIETAARRFGASLEVTGPGA
jgi:Winged helix DNA-binding domain